MNNPDYTLSDREDQLLLNMREEKDKLKIISKRDGNRLHNEFYFWERKLVEWEFDDIPTHRFPMEFPLSLYEEIVKINRYMTKHPRVRKMEVIFSSEGL